MELMIINTKGDFLAYIDTAALNELNKSGHTLEQFFGEKVRVVKKELD